MTKMGKKDFNFDEPVPAPTPKHTAGKTAKALKVQHPSEDDPTVTIPPPTRNPGTREGEGRGERKTVTCFRLDMELHTRLLIAAARHRKSASDIVEEALVNHIASLGLNIPDHP